MKNMKKLIMLIAMAVSLSMLTGCFSFLLAGTDDDDSREQNQVAETRKPKPRPRPRQKRPRPKPQPKPSTQADDEYTEEPAEDEPDTSYTTEPKNFASAGSVKPVNSEGFVEIIPPKEGIPSVAIDPITNPAPGKLCKGMFSDGKTIKIKPYLIAEAEVTYKLWREVYNWAIEHGYKFYIVSGKPGSCLHDEALKAHECLKENSPLPEYNDYEKHPVMHVSCLNCIVWCNAYTEMKTNSDEQCVYRLLRNNKVLKDATWKRIEYKKEKYYVYYDISKKGYRLPTEVEWEYAARWQKDNSNNNAVRHGNVWLTKLTSFSGANYPIRGHVNSKLKLPNGVKFESVLDDASRVAVVYRGNRTKGSKTLAVKTKEPNDCGLYDMSGNVAEWCFPCPENMEKPAILFKQSYSIQIFTRGASYKTYCPYAPIGYRKFYPPWAVSSHDVGFRLCKSR